MRCNYLDCAFLSAKWRSIRVIHLATVLILLPELVYPQQKQIDSLKEVIGKNSGIDKYEHLISLTRMYWTFNNKLEGLEFAQKANKLALEFGDSLKIVESFRIVGQILVELSRYQNAREVSLKALPIAKRHHFKNHLTRILNNLALTYVFQAKYDSALVLNFQALRLLEEDRNYVGLTVCLQNVGLVYYKLRDYEKALTYYNRSLELKKVINDDYDIEQLMVNIGLCHSYSGNFTQSKTYIDSALVICQRKVCNDNVIIDANFSLGVIYLGMGSRNEAEKYFLTSYSLSKKFENIRFYFDNIIYLSDIYASQNKITEALIYLREAEDSIDQGVPFNLEILKIYARLSELYLKQNNFAKTAHYQNKYIMLRDSIYNEELTTNLMKIEAEYLEKENLAKIASQEQILILQQEAIKRQKLLNILFSIIAVILVVLAVVLFRSNRQKKMINHLLDLKVKERTKELELNRNELLKACDERDLILERTARQIRSSIASMKGIYEVGRKDITDSNALRYINEVEETSKTLANTLLSLQHVQRKPSE